MRVFIIGGTGLVGRNLVTRFEDVGHTIQSTYHLSASEPAYRLDKTDADRVHRLINEFDPDVIIDTAAFHAVDECEGKRAKAWQVNVTGTKHVALAAKEADAHLIYFSTDYVFPGNPDDAPYEESDSPSPINYYGQTKYASEQAARIASKVTILRPSVIYGTASENFITWALGELRKKNELTIVDDQISSPTYAPDLARACVKIAERELTGLYHATGPMHLSRYSFTEMLAEFYGYDSELITPISTEQFGQNASRPENSSLDSTQLYTELGMNFKPPRDAFEEMRSN